MGRLEPLAKEQIADQLKDLPEWQWSGDKLMRSFVFDNFVTAFGFMTQVALLAEKLDHHPNWSNIYNSVHIALTTHDAGNKVTARDFALARAIQGTNAAHSGHSVHVAAHR